MFSYSTIDLKIVEIFDSVNNIRYYGGYIFKKSTHPKQDVNVTKTQRNTGSERDGENFRRNQKPIPNKKEGINLFRIWFLVP